MKTAVITGATSGIGNSILNKFLNDGYVVYAGYRDIRQKKDLEISENVVPFRIDLSKKWTIEEAVKTINASVEKIDVLVNVAGKVVAGPLETMSVNKIREQFEVNTFSQLEFAQGLFQKLDGGKIINISSMASYGIFPFLAPYCASKRALDMLFNSLRIETGSKVKVVSVKPGVIATPLWQKAIDENREQLSEGKYKIVGDFLMSNAIKNSNSGLNPSVVAKKVLAIANCANPKTSYTIGLDAIGAQLVAKLPQKLIDMLVESQLVKRVKAQLDEVLLVPETRTAKEEGAQDAPETTSVEEEQVEVVETLTVEESVDVVYGELEPTAPESELPSALEEAIENNKPKKRGRKKKVKTEA